MPILFRKGRRPGRPVRAKTPKPAECPEYGGIRYRFCPQCNVCFGAGTSVCSACGKPLRSRFNTD